METPIMAEMPTSGREPASTRPRTVEERIARVKLIQAHEHRRKERAAFATAKADLTMSCMELFKAVELGHQLKLDQATLHWFFYTSVFHIACNIAKRRYLPRECDHDDPENCLLREVRNQLAFADHCFGPNWVDARDCAALMQELSLGESA